MNEDVALKSVDHDENRQKSGWGEKLTPNAG